MNTAEARKNLPPEFEDVSDETIENLVILAVFWN